MPTGVFHVAIDFCSLPTVAFSKQGFWLWFSGWVWRPELAWLSQQTGFYRMFLHLQLTHVKCFAFQQNRAASCRFAEETRERCNVWEGKHLLAPEQRARDSFWILFSGLQSLVFCESFLRMRKCWLCGRECSRKSSLSVPGVRLTNVLQKKCKVRSQDNILSNMDNSLQNIFKQKATTRQSMYCSVYMPPMCPSLAHISLFPWTGPCVWMGARQCLPFPHQNPSMSTKAQNILFPMSDAW